MARDAARTKTATRRPRPSQKAPQALTFSHEDVARRAFEIYVARGASDGNALGDWVQAERELQGQAIPQPF